MRFSSARQAPQNDPGRWLGFLMGTLLAAGTGAAAQELKQGEAEPFPRPAASTADEPLAQQWSPARSAEYLDRAALSWLRERQCASCHTSYPYLMARPALGEPQAAGLVRMRQFLEERVASWDRDGPGNGLLEGTEGVTEVVATAATLAFHDAPSGKLHPRTRQALDRMWTLQQKDGSWTWNKHQLPPQEDDDYYGAVYAAVGVGHAPEKYAHSAPAREGVARLRQ